MLLSKSKRAPAIAFSSSEGFCLEGELRAILLIAAIFADERRIAGCAAGAAFPCRGLLGVVGINSRIETEVRPASNSAPVGVGSEARRLA